MNQDPSTNQPDNLELRFRLYNWLWIFGIFSASVSLFSFFVVESWFALLFILFSVTLALTLARSRFVRISAGLLIALLCFDMFKFMAFFGTICLYTPISFRLLIDALFIFGTVLFISDPELRNALGISEKKRRLLSLRTRYALVIALSLVLAILLVNLGVMLAYDGAKSFEIRFKKTPVIRIDGSGSFDNQKMCRRNFLQYSLLLPRSSRVLAILTLPRAIQGRNAISVWVKMENRWDLEISNGPESMFAGRVLGFSSFFGTDGPFDYGSEWIRWAVMDRSSLSAYVMRRVKQKLGRDFIWVETPACVGVARNTSNAGTEVWTLTLYSRSSDSCLSLNILSKTLDKNELLDELRPILSSFTFSEPKGYQLRMDRAKDEVAALVRRNVKDPFWPYGLVDGPMPESVKNAIPLARTDLKEGHPEDAKWRLIDPFYWQYKPAASYRLMGKAFIEAGEASRGAYYLEKALKLSPDDPELQNLLDLAMRDKKRGNIR